MQPEALDAAIPSCVRFMCRFDTECACRQTFSRANFQKQKLIALMVTDGCAFWSALSEWQRRS